MEPSAIDFARTCRARKVMRWEQSSAPLMVPYSQLGVNTKADCKALLSDVFCELVSHSKRYTIVLDFDMREQVRFVTDGKDVLEFVVQLEIKIDDAWTWIRRYDTMNGVAHLDLKYGDGTIDKHRAMNLPFKEGLTVALGEIGSNWQKHRSWYLEGRRKR